jgi:uncharacterized membrane protein
MVVPFEGFVVPPAPHTALLLAGTVGVAAALYSLQPPVTQKVTLTFAPWIVAGAGLHVLYQLGETSGASIYPSFLGPLFSAPAVYLTTFVLMGSVWTSTVVAGQVTQSATETGYDYSARYLGPAGLGAMLVPVWLLGLQEPGTFAPVLPTVGLLMATALTFVVYVALGMWRTYLIAETRYVAAFVLFAHAFDGVTTAIGVDVLGVGERSALPARILEFSAALPTAQYVGSGWLFVVVKLLIAAVVVVVFADYAREQPTQSNLLFALVAAVGLGPAANNYLLFLFAA